VVILLSIYPDLKALALRTLVELITIGSEYIFEDEVGSDPLRVYFTDAPGVDSLIEIVTVPEENPPICENCGASVIPLYAVVLFVEPGVATEK
jgi:hypothetical protein